MLGSHATKAWSATQASLATSSGEAEYYGVVRATGIGLGVQALLKDAGVSVPLRVWTDSEAAIASLTTPMMTPMTSENVFPNPPI